MARKKLADIIGDDGEPSGKSWREGELIDAFNLVRIADKQTAVLQDWLQTEPLVLTDHEAYNFERIYKRGVNLIPSWSEEDLRIKFIGHILDLGNLVDGNKIVTCFDKTISAEVEGIRLTVKADFMMARGIFDVIRTPYFHFQEYKPTKNPSGDSMAQLLEAFLIAQQKNNHKNPIYGVEVIGKHWSFVTMEGKEYCISKSFDATDRESLEKIIAVLRKFRYILDTRLLPNDE
ncbi:MAG: hypothetical protein EAZ95_08640 [Bacteroidetes bacterium]|nr:MAG: hypothetical protein EAZ95_08640 [Bacteroidota bacterium]